VLANKNKSKNLNFWRRKNPNVQKVAAKQSKNMPHFDYSGKGRTISYVQSRDDLTDYGQYEIGTEKKMQRPANTYRSPPNQSEDVAGYNSSYLTIHKGKLDSRRVPTDTYDEFKQKSLEKYNRKLKNLKRGLRFTQFGSQTKS